MMNKIIISAVIAATMTSAIPAQAGLWKFFSGETYKEYAHRTNKERIEKNLTWQWTKDDVKFAVPILIMAAPLVLSGVGSAGAAAGCAPGDQAVDAAGNVIGVVPNPGVGAVWLGNCLLGSGF